MKVSVFQLITAGALVALAVSCAASDKHDSAQQTADKKPVYQIDTVKIAPKEFPEKCMELEASQYIKISGSDDIAFENFINQIFIDRFNAFVSTTVAKDEGCPDLSEFSPEERNSPLLNMPAYLRSDFELLSQHPQIVSVIQNFVYLFGRGGNAYSVSAQTVNFDWKNRQLLTSADLGMSVERLPFIQERIKTYFQSLFPDDEEINYPKIEEKDFDKLQFAVRNDSVMLVIDAYPTAHFSYGIYTIPIDKLKRKK